MVGSRQFSETLATRTGGYTAGTIEGVVFTGTFTKGHNLFWSRILLAMIQGLVMVFQYISKIKSVIWVLLSLVQISAATHVVGDIVRCEFSKK